MSKEFCEWISYHIYLPWTGNEFLANFLPRLIIALKEEKQIKRFFFIRFTQGSYHIRLRLQKARFSDIFKIEKQNQFIIDEFRSALDFTNSQVWIQKTAYSREEHYFGETLETVYSELINECTSYLAMEMMSGIKEANYFLLLKFAATIHWLFVFSALDSNDLKTSLEESYEFAERHRLGESSIKFDMTSFLQKVPLVIERMSVASSESDNLQKAAALIEKLKYRGSGGRSVATHAIHLYCNKLGFSITQEAQVYEILIKLQGL